MKTKLSIATVLLMTILIWMGYTPSISQAHLIAKYSNDKSDFLADARGLRVHYRDQGARDGKVIVMLHGNSNSLHSFEPLVAGLSEEYRIVTLDFPGHGLTGAHPESRYDYTGLSEALELVVTGLALDNIVLLGHSMGGWVAWRYTVDHPEVIDSLILVSASGMPLMASDAPPDIGLGFKLLRSPIGPIFSSYTLPRVAIEKSMNKSVFKKLHSQDQIIDRSWELLRHPENRAALAHRSGVERELYKADLAKKIYRPTLLIWGKEDKFVPPSAALGFAERIKNSRMVLLPEVGHLPILEATDQVAQAIRDFVPKK